MNLLSSSVLLVSSNQSFVIPDIDQIDQFNKARIEGHKHKIFIIEVNSDNILVAEDFINYVLKQKPYASIILIRADSILYSDLLEILTRFPVSKVVNRPSLSDLQQIITESIEDVRTKEQQQELAILLKSKNEQLKTLYADLEDRVQRRQKELTQSRMKLLLTNHKESTLQSALLAIYQSRSVGEIETSLYHSLKTSFKVDLVRIFFDGQSQLQQQKSRIEISFSTFEAPLYLHNDHIGSVFFMRDLEIPFTRGEQDFLQKLAEAVALALDRMETLLKSENLNLQWQATFAAISDPVLIIDEDDNVISSNQAIHAKTLEPDVQSTQRPKCYELLFQREIPCENCRSSSRFKINPIDKSRTIEVSSQEINLVTEKKKTFVHLYRDITERVSLEKQLLESSKLAELGTIGSSIAHELNNPIGGILTYSQLIKMELPENDELRSEISSIEDGARRSKEIVQNLLSFSRNPEVDQVQEFDLRDIVSRALKIMELKSRAKGIHITVHLPKEKVIYKGHLNLLSQALQNILQNSYEAVLEKLNQQFTSGLVFEGKIIITMKEEARGNITIKVEDNGIGMDTTALKRAKDLLFTTKDPNFNPGLGLPIADRIIRDHQGKLDLNSVQYEKTTVLISLPRLVL